MARKVRGGRDAGKAGDGAALYPKRSRQTNRLRPRYGDYDDLFKSASAKYPFTRDFMAIVSYNDSIRRSDYGNLTGVMNLAARGRRSRAKKRSLSPGAG